MEEEREYHRRYPRAVNSPIRRRILRALNEGAATAATLQSETGLDEESLKRHLSIPEHGSCIEKEIKDTKTFYKPTREGRIVDHL
ncbi:MAG: winged helix-turn-helix domain-containing protein [Candidatus Bathyarchaeia archaeon]